MTIPAGDGPTGTNFDWDAATAQTNDLVLAQCDKVTDMADRIEAMMEELRTEANVLEMLTGGRELPVVTGRDLSAVYDYVEAVRGEDYGHEDCPDCNEYVAWVKGRGRRVLMWLMGAVAYIALLVWLWRNQP